MSEAQRVSRSRAKTDRAATRGADTGASAAHAPQSAAPAWAANHVGAPFGLGGVQRKMTIGPAGDGYEQEADRVASDVASGRSIAPSAISPIGALGGVGQRATASGGKPEQDKKAEPDRKPEAEKKKKEDPAAAMAVQKAAAPAAAPKDEKKKPEKAPEKKKDEKPAAAPVQKAAAPATPAKDEKKTPEKKKDEKPAAAPVQKAAAPAAAPKDEKKKDEKPAAAPVQKAAAPAAGAKEEKKDDKSKAPAAVQKASAGTAKQAPGTPKEKDKKQEKEKSSEQKLADAPIRKAPADAAQPPSTPKKKDKEQDKDKTTAQKPAAAPVQKATAPPDDTLSEAERDPKRPSTDEDAPIQRAAGGDHPTPSMEAAASRAVGGKGAGEPMQSSTRNSLESRMGVDLSSVRVHQDQAAQESSQAIQAKAFTHGNDIWLGPGESQSNLPLMAHEATHVVQQAGGVHRMLVQREEKKGKGPALGGSVDTVKKTVDLDEVHVPEIKKDFSPSTPHVFKEPEERTDQRQLWRDTYKSQVAAALPDKLAPLPGVSISAEGTAAEGKKGVADKTYFLQLAKGEGHAAYLIGTPAQLADDFVIPRWGPNGQPHPLDVDHKKELQIGGEASAPSNFWLLDASANRSSGAKISNELQKSINSAVASEVELPTRPRGKGAKAKANEPPAAAAEGEKAKTWKVPPTLRDLLKQGYTVTAKSFVPDLKLAGDPSANWEAKPVTEIAPLEPLKSKALTVKEAISRNLIGDKNELLIYPLPTGGSPRKIKWNPKETTQEHVEEDFFKGFRLTSVTYNIGGGGGSISGILFRSPKAKKKIGPQAQPLTMKLVDLGGLPYTTTIAKDDLKGAMKYAVLNGLSPINFEEVDIRDPGGIYARGKLAPSVPFFKKLDIDVVITGSDVALSKTFTKDDFNLPGPIKVTAASLTIMLGTSEASVSGDVFFEIERVGKGSLKGSLGTEGIEVEGSFDFDSELFDPAHISVGYKDGVFKGSGKIGIPEGKVKGIKSALLTASFEGEKIDATGTVKPSIPGIEQGELTFSYDPKTGVVIGGKLELKKDIPGLEGGSVEAELSKPAGGDKWKVKASGEATPKIPGVSSKLSVSYDDGAFDAMVVAGYDKGMLKGSIMVGATNRPFGDDGKPAGPPPEKGEKVTIYGGGSLTLKLAPWLQATAGVKLLPNGEIEVTGEIGLPAALEIFKEKKFDKNIFKIGIDIPIVGVAVAGQRIGIFANISGGLDLSAGIGPGELNQLKLAVTYNPAHEENTTVVGDANLHIPAHAGLRLFVRGSLGVGIPIVSASAGIEIGASLGLEGALDAGVHVEWSPSKGIDLKAQASVYVEPKLKFDVTGFVLVEADLWITTIELYSQRWQLASFEYGSGLKFGLKFPIHYVEGQPFDVSLSDIEFEVPKIEPGSLLEGLIKQIA